MVMAGRQTALLKDTTVPALPTDIVGHIYKPIEIEDSMLSSVRPVPGSSTTSASGANRPSSYAASASGSTGTS
jgi:hypothetical protein